MIRILLMFLLAVIACGDDELGPPPIATGNTCSPVATGCSGAGDDRGRPETDCTAFIGCFNNCDGDTCLQGCADVTHVDAEFCAQKRCDQLESACGEEDAAACTALQTCFEVTPGTSTDGSSGADTSTDADSTGSTTSGSGSTSNDEISSSEASGGTTS